MTFLFRLKNRDYCIQEWQSQSTNYADSKVTRLVEGAEVLVKGSEELDTVINI